MITTEPLSFAKSPLRHARWLFSFSELVLSVFQTTEDLKRYMNGIHSVYGPVKFGSCVFGSLISGVSVAGTASKLNGLGDVSFGLNILKSDSKRAVEILTFSSKVEFN